MAILLKNSFIDGQLDFSKGVDTYRTPARVPRNQLCLSVNGTTRQDFLSQRPGWRQIDLDFGDATNRTKFETGKFQGFGNYNPDVGPSQVIFSISGRIYRVDALTTRQVIEMPLPEVRSTKPDQVWFEQGENFLIIQDNISKPLIYDGSYIRVSDVLGTSGTDADGVPLREVPVGNVMAYAGGRLWVALPDGRSFVAGDLVFGPTGTAAYNRRDSFLRFTENEYLNGGFPFAVPANLAPIRAMKAVANLDTSLGQGPLQVFTPNGCFSVDAPTKREDWFSVTYPIKTVSLIDSGALSAWSTILVNGDIWYRSSDGARSFLIARRDFGTWGNRAMSYEVIRHLQEDNRDLLRYSSAALFDNRLLMTCDPQRSQYHGIYHRGLVVLDFIPLTSMSGTEPPTWDGLWTKPDILQIQTVESQGVKHCYAAVLAPADGYGVRRIQLWELTLGDGHDTIAGVETRIQRAIESPRFDFSPGSNRLEQKELEAADIWVDKLRGDVDITLYYRPDEYPCWFLWRRWQICAKSERCASDAVDGCQIGGLNLKPQFRARMGALRPPDNTLRFINVPSRVFYAVQYRLEITGECELTAVRLLAKRLVEQTFGTALPEEATCEELVCCDGTDFPNEPDTDDPEPDPNPGPGGSAGGPIGSGGSGGSGGGGGGSTQPIDPSAPDFGIPETNGWIQEWGGYIISGYSVTKTGAHPADDMTADDVNFWLELMNNYWLSLGPPPHTEAVWYWDWVDPYSGWYGDLLAKKATGNPIPDMDDPPMFQPGPMWRLNICFR